MNHRFLTFLLLSCFISQPLSAGTRGYNNKLKWVSALSAGALWARAGESQTFYLSPGIQKTYAAHQSFNTLASGELFLGMQKPLSYDWLLQCGIAAAVTGNAKLQGVIWDDADPRFDNLSYQYQVQHQRVAAKAKLLASQYDWITPWVSASVGVALNRATSFTNTPLITEALPNANFTNNNTTAITYTLGLGVQSALDKHWYIGLGFEFSDWGKSELGLADGQTMNTGLVLNHLYTNGVLFNLTYVS